MLWLREIECPFLSKTFSIMCSTQSLESVFLWKLKQTCLPLGCRGDSQGRIQSVDCRMWLSVESRTKSVEAKELWASQESLRFLKYMSSSVIRRSRYAYPERQIGVKKLSNLGTSKILTYKIQLVTYVEPYTVLASRVSCLLVYVSIH